QVFSTYFFASDARKKLNFSLRFCAKSLVLIDGGIKKVYNVRGKICSWEVIRGECCDQRG
ncbi:MAG: hypothetical protein IJW22_08555, partial [Clostridia bacterium]|nr:hypothetical protein [Clostridia bacterium]